MQSILDRYRAKIASASKSLEFKEDKSNDISSVTIKNNTDNKEFRDKFDLEVTPVESNDNDAKKALLEKDEIAKQDKDWKPLYLQWRAKKNQDNFDSLLKSLQPTINYALASNNAKGDPYIEAKAKVLAAAAIHDFDPSYETGLPTFLTSQLRKLTRVVRDSRTPIKIPENVFYDIQELKEGELELTDKLGREPDLQELADHLKMPISKIEKIRKAQVKQVSENQYFGGETAKADDDTKSSLSELGGEMPNNVREALAYAYSELDHRERKILEWSTGFGGSKILSPADIAKKLNISQSQVSRLTAKIAVKVEENLKALEG